MWINRDFRPLLASKGRLPANILLGARQVGKTNLLEKVLPENTRVLRMDDFATRELAQSEPALALGSLEVPTLVDEAQYAPAIFPEIKLRIDKARRENKQLPPLWLTGSNRAMMDKTVKESLAGRASFHTLHGISANELGEKFDFGNVLLRGGHPELLANQELAPVDYLNDYIQSYVEKDIVVTGGIQHSERFLRALRLLAGRSGQLLNHSEIGSQAGVKGQTLKEWISLLNRNYITEEVAPYFSNRNSRLIKSAKFFFIDIGLATRLQGFQTEESAIASPYAGALFETLVLSELVKTRDHLGLSMNIWHYRTKEGEEIDFLVEVEGKKGSLGIAIESKLAQQRLPIITVPKNLKRDFPSLQHVWSVSLSKIKTVQQGVENVHLSDLATKLLAIQKD